MCGHSTPILRYVNILLCLYSFIALNHSTDADPSRIGNYLTFNLNEENIPILLIYASLFIAFFILYLFIDHFPYQQYYDYCCGEFEESNTNETTPFLSSAPPPYNPVAAAAANPAQPETIIPFQPLREYVPALTPILMQKDEKYDVFLTHDWGTAATQFLNHRRVSAVNAKLSALGLKTWFDEERMEGWNVRDQMTRGISRAHCVIVFITERYASKINSANPADNCYYEFNFAVHRVSTQKMIPVVMEETMKDTRQWQGRLAAELANNLYVNMSDVIPKIVPERINNTEEEGDDVPKPSPENVVDEEDAVEFDQKCKEIIELVGSVLVKPLKDLTAEQTVLFFKSVGCLGIEDVLKEKRIVLSGKDLYNVETLEDLISLDLNLPRIKVRTILEEILHCKESGVRMSNLLRSVIG